MLTLSQLISLFGWMLVINLGLYLLAVFGVLCIKGRIAGIHKRLFHLTEEALEAQYFRYLANYKLAILMLNAVPYFALLMIR